MAIRTNEQAKALIEVIAESRTRVFRALAAATIA